MPEETSNVTPAPASAPTANNSALFMPAAIIIAGALIGIGAYAGLSKTQTANTGAPAPLAVNVKDVKTDGEPFIGKVDAPLTMAMWTDYQCPYCKAVEVGGVPQIPNAPAIPTLISDYVNTGKLRIVFKDFAFLGNDSITGAEYEKAIWELYPDKFYTWRAAMYKAQDQEGDQGFGNEASIVALTKKIPGLDAVKIKALVAQKKADYDAMIAADQAEGATFGITGTPGFVIGNQALYGAETLAKFKTVIDAQL